jgi:hypothetical protein
MEDMMITQNGRARAIYDEDKAQWIVHLTAPSRKEVRELHSEVLKFGRDNNLQVGVLQQRTLTKRTVVEQIDNPHHMDEDLIAEYHRTPVENTKRRTELGEMLTRKKLDVSVEVDEYTAKTIVRRA